MTTSSCDPDSALADALWHADNMGASDQKPMDNFADVYTVLAQEVRIWLRTNGFDIRPLPHRLYEDHVKIPYPGMM